MKSFCSILCVCFLASACFAQQAQHNAKSKKRHSGTSAGCGTHCGTERWALKTLTDSGASAFQTAQPADMKIPDLIAQTAPSSLPATRRVPFERTLVKVHAMLIGWKVESEAHGDQDFHIVIADPDDNSKQMIVEVPSPDCQGVCSSAFLEKFQANRKTVQDNLGQPEQHFVTLDKAWVVEITGPAFFDFNHGQIGLAPNCIEIHPVVDISFVNQSDQKIEPNQASALAHHCGKPAGGGGSSHAKGSHK